MRGEVGLLCNHTAVQVHECAGWDRGRLTVRGVTVKSTTTVCEGAGDRCE
jgi:hypothetical protein